MSFKLSISRMYVAQMRLIVCFMSQDKQPKTSRYSLECFQYLRYYFFLYSEIMYQLKLQSCFSILIPYEIQLYCSLCTHLRFPSVPETSNPNVYTICIIAWYTYIYIWRNNATRVHKLQYCMMFIYYGFPSFVSITPILKMCIWILWRCLLGSHDHLSRLQLPWTHFTKDYWDYYSNFAKHFSFFFYYPIRSQICTYYDC